MLTRGEKVKNLFLLLLAAMLLPMPVSAESYLCIAEHAGSNRYNKNTNVWESTALETDSKYIVSKVVEGNPFYGLVKWEVIEHGSNIPVTWCKGNFDTFGLLSCEASYNNRKFKMNKKAMNFRILYDPKVVYGQLIIYEESEGKDQPGWENGICSRL